MKNPHGVEPTRFMNNKALTHGNIGIMSVPKCGPHFGYDDLGIKGNKCLIKNDGTNSYECHPQYKQSLYLGKNNVSNKILDYEVYCIDYESKYTVDHVCKHPDIMMEYIETKDISEESLKQFDDDTELLSDLNAIQCENSSIRLKISRYCLKNPSELLPNTQLVNQQYDDKLREWLENDYKWKLLYRSSEHGYSAESFHKCCDNKGPTLVVIKSREGWIFGGYTTQSWSGYCIYLCI